MNFRCCCRLLLDGDGHILDHGKNVHFIWRRRSLIWNCSFWNLTFLLFLNWVTILLWFRDLIFGLDLNFFFLRSFNLFLFRFFVFSSSSRLFLIRNHIGFALLTDLYGQITAHLLGSNILLFYITDSVFSLWIIYRIQN